MLNHAWIRLLENRFPSFPKEWRIDALGKFFNERKEHTSDLEQCPLHSFTIKNGVTPKTERYNREFLLKDKVNNQFLIVYPGDLVYNPMNLRFGAISLCRTKDPVTISAYYYVLRLKNLACSPIFLEALLCSSQMLSFFDAIAIGSLIEKRRVHLSLFRATPVLIPPLPEQKKIAEILSTWDAAIKQTRELIETKMHLKKALMQQLLTEKSPYRSYDHDSWCVKPLGDLIQPVSRSVSKPQKPYLSIGIRSHGKGTFQKIVEQPEKVMMDTLYHIEANDLIVNITFAWEGAIAIASEEDSGGLVSHRFPTYRIREAEADINFFRNLILTKKFVWDLGLISPGGAGRNRVLNQKDFLKLKVVVPSVEAQKDIGKTLAAADNELHLWEDYLKALEKQKRGLMQKLLTGEVRVKP